MSAAVKYVVGACLAILAIILLIGYASNGQESPQQFEARKRECAEAMMSNLGTSTENYSDKMAYEAHVREHCHGLEINGKPLDK